MNIQFNKVTKFSIAVAIILYVGTFVLAFCLGLWAGLVAAPLSVVPPERYTLGAKPSTTINSATFTCDNNKTIQAVFFNGKVELMLSDKRNLLLTQALSASGARYTTPDESFIFWNKGNTAFVQEGTVTTYQNCVTGR